MTSRLLLLALLTPTLLHAETYTALCTKVSDGDTFVVKRKGKEEKIRIYGIDAPESGQDYGDKSKAALKKMIEGKKVKIEVKDVDQYDRTVAKVYLGKKYINLDMVNRGAAWHYAYYAKDETDLAEAEKKARAAKKGLWSGDNPISPYEWRKANKEK